MKVTENIRILVMMMGLALSVPSVGNDTTLVLASNGQANYVICYDQGEGPVVQFAAEEMSKYLGQISGATFSLATDTATDLRRIVLGRDNPLALAHGEQLALDSVRDDGFRIMNIGEDIYIAGAIPRGTLYGVYHFLDLYLGVRWFSPDFEVVPSHDSLAVAAMNDLQNPDFRYREMFNHDTDDPYYRQRNRLNGSRMHRSPLYNSYPAGLNTWSHYCKEGPPDLGGGGHNFYSVVPNSSCHSGGQLLMMSSTCREEAANTFKEAYADWGDVFWYGFSQNDNGWSPDDASRSFAASHGDVLSAPLLDMVINVADRVRETYPDARFATSAYQWSFPAPEGMTVPDYVMVELAPIEANFGYSYNDPENADTDADQKKWNSIATNLTIWDYVTNFQNYLQPLPNVYPMCRNIKYYAALENVKGYMGEGAYSTAGAELADLRTWVASRLLWDAGQDYKALVYEFINGYYGPAAYYIRQYVDALHDAFEATHDRIAAKQRISSPYLNLDFILLADQLMASADGVAAGPYAKHVHEVRLGVDMTILLMGHLYKAEAEERGITWMEDPGRRDRFEAYAAEAHISHYSEDSGLGELYAAMDIDRVAPPVPGIAAGLDDSDWVDYQDYDLAICCGANLAEDSEASDHGTVKMPADGVWSTQMSLDLLPREGKWRLYAYVRVDPKSEGTTAFSYGVNPDGGTKTVSLSDVADGKYHLIEFPGNPWSFETGRGLWFAGGDAIYHLYIDRIVAVREGATGVEDVTQEQYPLEIHCFPNPFCDNTTIRYSLPETTNVTISVYNANGKKVMTLVDEVKEAGNYQTVFKAGTLPPGMYYYHLQLSGKKSFKKTGKLILIK